jgi:hypothetical protein
MGTSQIVGSVLIFCGLVDMVLSINVLPAFMIKKGTPEKQIKWVRIGLILSGMVLIVFGIMALAKILPLE